MAAEVVIIVPVLRRPQRASTLVESITSATPEPHRILFVCSPDDTDEQKAVSDTKADMLVVDWEPGHGDYAKKINAGYRASTEPLLFLAADDLKFHPGWLTAAQAHLSARVQVVGTQDLGNPRVLRGVHSTHTLVTRRYADRGTIDEPGKVYHEGYWHEYCDDELVETAWYRKAWAFAADSVVEHLHPAWGKAQMDDLYRQEPRRLRYGRRLFLRRRHLWSPNDGPG